MFHDLQMRSRRAKVELLCANLSPTASTLALDVGTGTGEGGAFSELYPFPSSVIGMDILFSSVQKARSRLRGVVTADACRLPFRDGAFDLVMSNAVIEHLPSSEMQRDFANEVRRVGKSYFVTTPNRWFPIELHYRFPLFQFLPRGAQKWLNRNFNLGFVKRGDWLDVKLLSSDELRDLFPDARVVKQRITFMAETLIAYRSGAG